MNDRRLLRFFIPPVVLLVSLLFLAWWDGKADLFRPSAGENWGSALAAGSLVVVATGFLIGLLVTMFLRVLSLWRWTGSYEMPFTDEELKSFCSFLYGNWSKRLTPYEMHYAVADFDHGRLTKGIHEWIGRRWDMMNVSLNTAAALILALIASRLIHISWHSAPVFIVLFFAGLAVANGIWVRHDVRGMLWFQLSKQRCGARSAWVNARKFNRLAVLLDLLRRLVRRERALPRPQNAIRSRLPHPAASRVLAPKRLPSAAPPKNTAASPRRRKALSMLAEKEKTPFA